MWSGGFTLIEVIGAIVVFSLGLLMVMELGHSFGRQMEYAAIRSELVTEVQERLDSLHFAGFDGVAVGSSSSTLTVRGRSYALSVVVTQESPLRRQAVVSLSPASGSGPSHTGTAWLSDRW